jgi:hypothetical protein
MVKANDSGIRIGRKGNESESGLKPGSPQNGVRLSQGGRASQADKWKSFPHGFDGRVRAAEAIPRAFLAATPCFFNYKHNAAPIQAKQSHLIQELFKRLRLSP